MLIRSLARLVGVFHRLLWDSWELGKYKGARRCPACRPRVSNREGDYCWSQVDCRGFSLNCAPINLGTAMFPCVICIVCDNLYISTTFYWPTYLQIEKPAMFLALNSTTLNFYLNFTPLTWNSQVHLWHRLKKTWHAILKISQELTTHLLSKFVEHPNANLITLFIFSLEEDPKISVNILAYTSGDHIVQMKFQCLKLLLDVTSKLRKIWGKSRLVTNENRAVQVIVEGWGFSLLSWHFHSFISL